MGMRDNKGMRDGMDGVAEPYFAGEVLSAHAAVLALVLPSHGYITLEALADVKASLLQSHVYFIVCCCILHGTSAIQQAPGHRR